MVERVHACYKLEREKYSSQVTCVDCEEEPRGLRERPAGQLEDHLGPLVLIRAHAEGNLVVRAAHLSRTQGRQARSAVDRATSRLQKLGPKSLWKSR